MGASCDCAIAEIGDGVPVSQLRKAFNTAYSKPAPAPADRRRIIEARQRSVELFATVGGGLRGAGWRRFIGTPARSTGSGPRRPAVYSHSPTPPQPGMQGAASPYPGGDRAG